MFRKKGKCGKLSEQLLSTFSAPSQTPSFDFNSFIYTGTGRLPLQSALFDSPNSREILPDDFWPVYILGVYTGYTRDGTEKFVNTSGKVGNPPCRYLRLLFSPRVETPPGKSTDLGVKTTWGGPNAVMFLSCPNIWTLSAALTSVLNPFRKPNQPVQRQTIIFCSWSSQHPITSSQSPVQRILYTECNRIAANNQPSARSQITTSNQMPSNNPIFCEKAAYQPHVNNRTLSGQPLFC
jgi:hypothetical protein